MLIVDYSKKTRWYTSFVNEIFAGIILDDIHLDEEKIINDINNIVLHFTVDLCQAIYDQLLETNNKRDIHIYLVAIKIAAYDPDIIISSVQKKDIGFLNKYPMLFMLLFSRRNLFKYKSLRDIYEAWHE
ncbi:MAG: hypothetical protein ACRCWB_06685 [Enterovibrio sp.]